MPKIYGYKEKDVIALAEKIKTRNGETLTEIFKNFAEKHGKAQGTVRNLYYALAKATAENKEFRDKYLDGEILAVNKIVAFDKNEEIELIEKIKAGKLAGKSVRATINELAGGDAKKALRMQNKFRGVLKKSAENSENRSSCDVARKSEFQSLVSEFQFNRLKKEINGLMERVAIKEKRENSCLKEKIKILEAENLRLKNLLFGAGKNAEALNYFGGGNGRSFIN